MKVRVSNVHTPRLLITPVLICGYLTNLSIRWKYSIIKTLEFLYRIEDSMVKE